MATTKLFYEEPFTATSQSVITDIIPRDDGKLDIIIDKTIFYPEGGGQPADSGTIAGFTVCDVQEDKENIIHTIDTSGHTKDDLAKLFISANVICRLDFERRIDHSEQHTAQHLLSSVVYKLFGAKTISFHLGSTHSFIDLDCSNFDSEMIEQTELEMMKNIRSDYKIITHVCPPEDISSFPLRKPPKVHADIMRVVEIDNFEYVTCCGTHLSHTSQLGIFRILKAEKYKRGTRLYFVAGTRAWLDIIRLSKIVNKSSVVLETNEDNIVSSIQKQKEKLLALEHELYSANDTIAKLEAAKLVETNNNSKGFVYAKANSLDIAIRLAKAIAAKGMSAIVYSEEALKAVSAVPENTIELSKLLSPIVSSSGGKGGGGKTYYQAAFPNLDSLNKFLESAKF